MAAHSLTSSPVNVATSSVQVEAEYEEVDFDPEPRTVAFYDVLRKDTQNGDDDDVIYDLPPNS